MGLFSMACSGLSMYIWAATAYHVYQPLANSLAAATPSFHPSSLLAGLQHALMGGGSEEATTPTSARRPRRRKQLTLAEAQREQLRDSLKVLVVWLLYKGVEPLLDNTLGYVVPLYTCLKMFGFLTFARFRAQLSLHLFDSFVVPLGRPNTPLINSTALTALVLPTLRFMLSLPFAHLTVALKNSVAHLWPIGSDPVTEATSTTQTDAKRDGASAIVPPPKSSELRRPATIIRRDPRPGSGAGGDNSGGGGSASSHSLMTKRSIDSLASTRNFATDGSARPRSVSSRIPSTAQHAATLAQLQALPSVPLALPRVSRENSSPSATTSHTSVKVPMTFAHIPSAHVQMRDIVPPPTAKRPAPHLTDSATLFSPRMPGFLGGGSGAQAANTLAAPATGHIGLAAMQGFTIGDESVLASRSAAPPALLVPDGESDGTMKGGESAASTPRTAKGKRKADADDTTVSAAASTAAKTRTSPGKRSRTKGAIVTSSTTAAQRKRKGVDAESTAAPKRSPTTVRSRTKPASRAASTEAGTSAMASGSRARRKATD